MASLDANSICEFLDTTSSCFDAKDYSFHFLSVCWLEPLGSAPKSCLFSCYPFEICRCRSWYANGLVIFRVRREWRWASQWARCQTLSECIGDEINYLNNEMLDMGSFNEIHPSLRWQTRLQVNVNIHDCRRSRDTIILIAFTKCFSSHLAVKLQEICQI